MLVVRQHKLHVVCLQETKLREWNDKLMRSVVSGRNWGWNELDAIGNAGGMLILWDNTLVKIKEKLGGIFTISCKFENVVDSRALKVLMEQR